MTYVPFSGPIRAKFANNPEPTTVAAVCAQFEKVEGLKIEFLGQLPERFIHGYPWAVRMTRNQQLKSLLKRLGRYQDYICHELDFQITTASGATFTLKQLNSLARRGITMSKFREL